MKKYRYTITQNQNTSSFYTITYYTNGGTSIPTRHLPVGQPYTPPIPEKENNQFEGWYLDELFEIPFDQESPIQSDINLYAKWAELFLVTFDSQGGTSVESQTIVSGQNAIEPTSTKTNYELSGWYLNGNLFDFNTPITGNITLAAQWVAYGETVFSPGTTQWIVPNDVYEVSVVAIGAGESGPIVTGENTNTKIGGGGGALAWKNNIPVTPGETITVVVGLAQTTTAYAAAPGSNGFAGGESYFKDNLTVWAEGGGTSAIANFVGDGGGNGGPRMTSRIQNTGDRFMVGSGGSSAGGYTADGVAGGYMDTYDVLVPSQAGQGGSGGGGGARFRKDTLSGEVAGGAGGGTGVYGQGINGGSLAGSENSLGIPTFTGDIGWAGSGGNTTNINALLRNANYGAGGPGYASRTLDTRFAYPGGNGWVRVVWGIDRQFPATNVGPSS